MSYIYITQRVASNSVRIAVTYTHYLRRYLGLIHIGPHWAHWALSSGSVGPLWSLGPLGLGPIGPIGLQCAPKSARYYARNSNQTFPELKAASGGLGGQLENSGGPPTETP